MKLQEQYSKEPLRNENYVRIVSERFILNDYCDSYKMCQVVIGGKL